MQWQTAAKSKSQRRPPADRRRETVKGRAALAKTLLVLISRWSAPEAGILVVARRSSRVLRGIFLASGCEEDGHLAYVFSPGIAPGHVVFQLA